jgi:hypothetical protein
MRLLPAAHQPTHHTPLSLKPSARQTAAGLQPLHSPFCARGLIVHMTGVAPIHLEAALSYGILLLSHVHTHTRSFARPMLTWLWCVPVCTQVHPVVRPACPRSRP